MTSLSLRFYFLSFALKPFRLLRSWYPRRQVVVRAIFPFLRLNGLVIHIHVVLNSRHVFTP